MIVISLVLMINCVEVEENTSFKQEYQGEICDKYLLYAKTMDVEGRFSLYREHAIVNVNGRVPLQSAEKIRINFVELYSSSESINHSAKVIAAHVLRNKVFAYGKWKKHLRMELDQQERNTCLLIT